MALNLHSLDPRLAKALSHDLRTRALELLVEESKSPKLIAAELEVDLRSVAYHVRVLKKLGCIELVETLPRRGAVEHVYCAADWVLKAYET